MWGHSLSPGLCLRVNWGHFKHSRAPQTALETYVGSTESHPSALMTSWATLLTPADPLPTAWLSAHSQVCRGAWDAVECPQGWQAGQGYVPFWNKSCRGEEPCDPWLMQLRASTSSPASPQRHQGHLWAVIKHLHFSVQTWTWISPYPSAKKPNLRARELF